MRNFEDNAWADYCVNHPSIHIAQACLKNVTLYQFWCLADNYSDLLRCLHMHIRLVGSFGLKVGLYHRPNQINKMNDSRGGR